MNCGTPHRLGSPKIRSKGRGQVWNALRQILGLPSKGIYDFICLLVSGIFFQVRLQNVSSVQREDNDITFREQPVIEP